MYIRIINSESEIQNEKYEYRNERFGVRIRFDLPILTVIFKTKIFCFP